MEFERLLLVEVRVLVQAVLVDLLRAVASPAIEHARLIIRPLSLRLLHHEAQSVHRCLLTGELACKSF